jgi:Eco29kI restriction endonuclease
MPPPLYNPLDKANLGRSVVDALMAAPPRPLGDLGDIRGAGVYAIYYAGPFAPYAPLAKRNAKSPALPIYIGKAVPSGGRKGLAADDSADSDALLIRLREHADSVAASSDLDIGDFQCRFLGLDDIWIGLGETLLIQRFNPLWNQVVEGFGNHDPGKGRRKGKRPAWDELHPGRPWARKLAPAKKPRVEILADVARHLSALDAR